MGLKKTNILPFYHLHETDTYQLFRNDSGLSTVLPMNGTTTTPATIPANSTLTPAYLPPCKWILYTELGHSRVRLWDVIILIPNALFLAFLILRMRTAISKLRNTSSPIFLTFYGLVLLVAVISVLRCVVSMMVNATMAAGDITDKLLWLVLRFFLLSTELSVVTFGLAFGHLDSKTSIRRVLIVTTFIGLAYSVTQGTLEFLYHDERFHVNHPTHEYDIFGHGGMIFWFASSTFFFIVYSFIVILPHTGLRQRFSLPSKKSFYWYSGVLALLNLTQAVGSGMLFFSVMEGMCVVDVTAFAYFTCFAPLVYVTFLREFFAHSQPPDILFSYKAQIDDSGDEDNLSLPYQSANSNKLGAEDGIPDSMYDSTPFDASSPNPLYNVDMHFQPHLYSVNADVHT